MSGFATSATITLIGKDSASQAIGKVGDAIDKLKSRQAEFDRLVNAGKVSPFDSWRVGIDRAGAALTRAEAKAERLSGVMRRLENFSPGAGVALASAFDRAHVKALQIQRVISRIDLRAVNERMGAIGAIGARMALAPVVGAARSVVGTGAALAVANFATQEAARGTLNDLGYQFGSKDGWEQNRLAGRLAAGPNAGSREEMSRGLITLDRMGVARDQQEAVLRQAGQVANAMAVPFGDAVTRVMETRRNWGMDQAQTQSAMDTAMRLGRLAPQGPGGIAQELQGMGETASQAGLTYRGLGGILAGGSRALGRSASSEVSSLMTMLDPKSNNFQYAEAALGKLGINAQRFKRAWGQDANAAMLSFLDTVNKSPKAAEALREMFSDEQAATVRRMASGVDSMRSAMQGMGGGELAEEAARRTNTFTSAMGRVWGQIERIGHSFNTGAIGRTLASMIDSGTSALDSAMTALENVGDRAMKFVNRAIESVQSKGADGAARDLFHGERPRFQGDPNNPYAMPSTMAGVPWWQPNGVGNAAPGNAGNLPQFWQDYDNVRGFGRRPQSAPSPLAPFPSAIDRAYQGNVNPTRRPAYEWPDLGPGPTTNMLNEVNRNIGGDGREGGIADIIGSGIRRFRENVDRALSPDVLPPALPAPRPPGPGSAGFQFPTTAPSAPPAPAVNVTTSGSISVPVTVDTSNLREFVIRLEQLPQQVEAAGEKAKADIAAAVRAALSGAAASGRRDDSSRGPGN